MPKIAEAVAAKTSRAERDPEWRSLVLVRKIKAELARIGRVIHEMDRRLQRDYVGIGIWLSTLAERRKQAGDFPQWLAACEVTPREANELMQLWGQRQAEPADRRG